MVAKKIFGRALRGDCLKRMKEIEDHSVDLILCDLPYGTTACKWDTVIPFEPLWEQYRRITKLNAAIVLTAAQPFTSALVMSNTREFKYEWIWRKNMGSGFASAKYQPMRYHESILVFYRARPTYNPQKTQRLSEESTRRIATGPIRAGGENTSEHVNLKTIYAKYDPYLKGPETVLDFKSVPNGGGKKLHPTQKPVELMEYLIRTYTNEYDTVLDNCMGSGTTGVACVNTNRSFIGIEHDSEYYSLAVNRIRDAKQKLASRQKSGKLFAKEY